MVSTLGFMTYLLTRTSDPDLHASFMDNAIAAVQRQSTLFNCRKHFQETSPVSKVKKHNGASLSVPGVAQCFNIVSCTSWIYHWSFSLWHDHGYTICYTIPSTNHCQTPQVGGMSRERPGLLLPNLYLTLALQSCCLFHLLSYEGEHTVYKHAIRYDLLHIDHK